MLCLEWRAPAGNRLRGASLTRSSCDSTLLASMRGASHIAANTNTLSVTAGLDFAAVGHARREGCAQDPSSFPSDCCCLQPNFRVTGRSRTGRWLRACIRHETDRQRLKDTGKPLALVSGWPHKLTRARAAGATFLLQTPHTGLVTALNFSAAGVLASGSEDTSVRVYKADYTGIAYVTPVSLSPFLPANRIAATHFTRSSVCLLSTDPSSPVTPTTCVTLPG